MSKKTRKKTSKTGVAKAAPARSKKPVKTPSSKARSTGAVKATAKAGRTTAAASHKTASKPSRSRAAATKVPATPGKSGVKAVAREPSIEKAKATALPLAEGSKAPAFSLPRDGGATVSLSDFAGKNLVLFFYPRANTPGCTREAIDFSRLSRAFAAHGTAVVGISADPPKAQESFRDKHQLTTPLASDEPHEMLEAYGVWGEKSMYGKIFHGVIRSTVLIGSDGRVIRIWRNVKVDGHAEEVLAAVESL